MKKRLIILVLILCFIVTGCSKVQESVDSTSSDEIVVDSNSSDYYNIIIDNTGTDTREIYYSVFYNDEDDFMDIGQGLERLCLNYFSTDTYYMKNSDHLTYYEESSATGDYFQMMGRPETHEYSIQPGADEVVDGVESCVLFQCMYAVDFYTSTDSGYEFAGLAICAIIASDYTDSDTGVTYTYSQDTIDTYSQNAISTIYSYYANHEEYTELKNLPIFITIYQMASAEDNISGGFTYSCYCNGSLGTIQTVDHEKVYFTSDEASELDSTTYSEFVLFKQKIKESAVDAVGVVGEATYYDGVIESMTIDINMNCKVYDEFKAMCQYVTSLLNTSFTADFEIKVRINSQSDTKGVVVKSVGEDASFYMF